MKHKQVAFIDNDKKHIKGILDFIKKFSDIFKGIFYDCIHDRRRFYDIVDELTKKLKSDSLSFFRLTAAYFEYTNNLRKPNFYNPEMMEEEKVAHELHFRTYLSHEDKIRLNESLIKLSAKNSHVLQLNTATSVLSIINKEYDFFDSLVHRHNRQEAEDKITEILLNSPSIKKIHNYSELVDAQGKLNIDGKIVLDLVVSRILMIGLDNILKSEDETKTIFDFLVPCYGEQNRLLSQRQVYTGEDLFRVKVRQLKFLFDGLDNIDWRLNFIEDEAKSEGKKRSTDIIAEMLDTDAVLAYRDIKKRIVLISQDELSEERKLYVNGRGKGSSELSGDEFTKMSYKGGAMQTGMRYLAQSCKDKKYGFQKSEAIILTDSDTSNNLGHTGILLNDMFINDRDVVIGSRRIGGSNVVGKSSNRRMMSSVFNMLVKIFVNLHLNDTQSGFKAIRTKTILDLESNGIFHFSELGMSYDVELLKIARLRGKSICETPITWKDSPLESTSSKQGQDMFKGLLNIRKYLYYDYSDSVAKITSQQYTDMSKEEKKDFHIDRFNKATKRIEKYRDYFQKLLELGNNPEFDFMVRNAHRILTLVKPKELKQFSYDVKRLIYGLSSGDITEEEFSSIYDSLNDMIFYLQKNKSFGFILNQFPQIEDVLELVYLDRENLIVILPFLFGKNVLTDFLSCGDYISFKDYSRQKELIGKTLEEKWQLWGEDAVKFISYSKGGSLELADLSGIPIPLTKKHEREQEPNSNNRIAKGINRLQKLNEKMVASNKRVRVGFVMQFNFDGTTREYVDNNLKNKFYAFLDMLKKNGIANFDLDITVVDARTKKESGIDKYIKGILDTFKLEDNVTAQLITNDDAKKGKGSAISFGMRDAFNRDCELVGFIDFSNKIDLLEMTNLVAEAMENEANNAVVIGSRRLEESTVVNKSVGFLLRSFGLNIIVKAFFPLLYRIKDTQAGFKVFGKDAWNKITSEGVGCNGLGFDVELLQIAVKKGLLIKELPVDFKDNTLDKGFDLGITTSDSVLEDIIEIRSRLTDDLMGNNDTAYLLNGGAESVVFKIGDSVVKVPNSEFDNDMFNVIKYFLLQDRKEMSIDEQEERVIAKGYLSKIVNSGIGKLIPKLREWPEFNVFIMKLIALVENKNYKSIGYKYAYELGSGLVVPFNYIDYNMKYRFRGEDYQITPDMEAKQSVFLKESFRSKFKNEITKDFSKEVMLKKNRTQIDEALELFYALWKRGLFDLDTNVMCDTGYHEGKLMVLDPGEVIMDLDRLDVEKVRSEFRERYDVKEMQIMLNQFAPEISKEVVEYYENSFNQFLEYAKQDKNKAENNRDFAVDQREPSFIEGMYRMPQLPRIAVSETSDDSMSRTKDSLFFSSLNYQPPFRMNSKNEASNDMPDLSLTGEYVNFFRPVPEDFQSERGMNNSNIFQIPVRYGGFTPIMNALRDREVLYEKGSHLMIMDSGFSYRNTLIGLQNGIKGNLVLSGMRLAERIADSLTPLVNKLNELQPLIGDYMVISACDNLMNISEEEIARIVEYFSRAENKPGYFHYDLPDAGNDILPTTLTDLHRFMFRTSYFREMAYRFLSSIPLTNGFVKSNTLLKGKQVNAFGAFFSAFERVVQFKVIPAKRQIRNSSANVAGVMSSFAPTDVISQFIVFNACKKYRGLKTPLVMVMRKDFLKEVVKRVVPLIPEYMHSQLTWRDIFEKAMKSDLPIWKASKPKLISMDKWIQIYNELQLLKEEYHIDYSDDALNELRVFRGKWQMFDDPYSLLQFAKGTYEKDSNGIIKDESSVANIQLNGYGGDVVALNSSIKGNVTVSRGDKYLNNKRPDAGMIFYNVNLAEEASIDVPSNHLVVEIDGIVYSMDMRLQNKEGLSKEIVYKYVNGKPEKYMAYKDFYSWIKK